MDTAHPNHAFISSEDVEGTKVFDRNGTRIGEIDHLMIDKVSGRVRSLMTPRPVASGRAKTCAS